MVPNVRYLVFSVVPTFSTGPCKHRYIRIIDYQSTCRTVDMGVERVVCYSSTLPGSTGVPGRMRRASKVYSLCWTEDLEGRVNLR